ncbi:MAG: NAD+ synthase, partial [Bacteroidales bacterium]
MEIALAQLNYHVGNFEKNSSLLKEYIRYAESRGADLVLFSELAICGYPPLDLLEYKAFIDKCIISLNDIAVSCKKVAAVIGGPSINLKPSGKHLFNSAFFIRDGKLRHSVHKSLLPTYDIFDEYRYFEPNTDFKTIRFKNKNLALTICEDVWDDQPFDNEFGKTRLYNISPMEELLPHRPDFVVNISASPFSYSRDEVKKNIFIGKAKKYGIPIFMVNQVGGQTELIFDGGSMVIGPDGNLVDRMKMFEEDFQIYNLEELTTGVHARPKREPEMIAKIHNALVLGLRDYFRKMVFKKATLGLSGGIDSAVSLVLAARALGSENIHVLLLPSKYSSRHSVTDAISLAENLNVRYDTIPIESIVTEFEHILKPIFKNLPPDHTEENIQARIRAVLLMALSNKFGHILLNTSNKSEAAVGYGTLYGDMAGGLSILGDVFKTDVYRLAEYINRDKEIIPKSIISKPPSAELREGQKDTDSLPEYDILDRILYRYIELQQSEQEIIKQGFDPDLVKNVIELVNRSEYKRYQAPPILRISSKAFG